MKSSAGYEENIFKLTQDKVYEKDISSKYLIINAIMDNRKKIDQYLQEINLGQNFIYILSLYTTSKLKIASLYINNYRNIEV